MIDDWLSAWLHAIGGVPCFRVYGKARAERAWRVVSVFATGRRDATSRWPLWRNTCVTWTSEVVAVGWDFARELIEEQVHAPASRQYPVEVAGGRLHDLARRARAGGEPFASCGEILAHEIGHTWQARRLGPVYLPLVGAVTIFREGDRPWNRFENEASAVGQFGGLVNGSVGPALVRHLAGRR
jgi:hypothetical protein